MENEKYLTEERYQKNNAKVKKVGKILLIIGIIILVLSLILIIIGFFGAGNSASNIFDKFNNEVINIFDSMDEDISINEVQDIIKSTKDTSKGIFGTVALFVIGGFLNFVGLSLTIAGIVTMFIAHRREIVAYTTQQVMPVEQEGIEKITPTIDDAAGTISQSISKGIQEGKSNFSSNMKEKK